MNKGKKCSGISRRQFHKRLLGAAAAGLAAPALIGRSLSGKSPGSRIIDFHTHLGQSWGKNPGLSAAELLTWMDEHYISQAVVLPLISPEAWDYPITTDFVLRETKPHRDRLIPFCLIDPRTMNLRGHKEYVDLLQRYIDAGTRGFGEHKPGIRIDDPRNLELYAACAEVNLPVLFHMDTRRNMDIPGLPGLANVLKEVPDGIFVGHAQGWWASISGSVKQKDMQSYPEEKVVPGGAIDALMDKYPNIYGDLSAGSGANAFTRDLDFGRKFLIRRADRILFGTDYLTLEQPIPQFELFEALNLPTEVQRQIMHGNAQSLLNSV